MPDTPDNRQNPRAGAISSTPDQTRGPLDAIPLLDQNPREGRTDRAGSQVDYSLGESGAGHGLSSDFTTQISSAGPAEQEETNRRRGRGRRPPPTYSITDEIRLDTIDPRYTAEERAAEDAVAGFDRDSGMMGAEFERRAAAIQQQQAQRQHMFAEQERQRVAAAEQAHDSALSDLEAMNQSVMNQRIDPARFYTANRGAGLGAAASVALGVLGQGLNPNLQNTAMVIIDRAIDRDIQAQVSDMANQQQGVQTARNLYGDMLRTFREEGAAREALRGMYLAEMERRIEALGSQSRSMSETRNANRIVHALRLERARANVAAARSQRTTTLKVVNTGRQRAGDTRGAEDAFATMRGNSAIGNAAAVSLMQEQGLMPSLPPQTQEISSTDIRSSDTASTPRTPRQAPEEVVSVTDSSGNEAEAIPASQETPASTPGESGGEPAPVSARTRRANRQAYNDPERTNHDRLRGDIRVITNEAGARIGAGYLVGSESIDSGRGTRITYFEPSSQGGQLVAISRNGSQRLISTPTDLTRGERLMGRRLQQTIHQRATADVERARRQTSNASLGGGLFLTPAGRQQFTPQERLEFGGNLRNSHSLYRLAARTREIIARNQETNFNVFRGGEAGTLASNYLCLMGRMASMAGLGTLQEGERAAIGEMTGIGSLSSDWLIGGWRHERALAALQDIMESAQQHITDNPLTQSGQIRRAENATDIDPGRTMYAPPSAENAAVQTESAAESPPSLLDRASDFISRGLSLGGDESE